MKPPRSNPGLAGAGEGRPAAAPTTTVRVPSKRITLDNGLRVLLHEDRRLPVVHVALWYHVGSRNERPWRTGFAHLFEHLMFEGSRHNDTHFVRLMEQAGASLSAGGVNGTTSHDRTNYYETVPREALGLALWAESDRMAYLLDVLDESRLDTQREVVRNERFQRMDNVPYGTAWEKMFHALFPPGHPYSWDVIGDLAQLDEASLAEVHEFFRTFYVPNNAVLVIAGDYDERRARDLLARYFDPIPPGSPPAAPESPLVRLEASRRIRVEEEVPHPRIYCGWPTVPFFHEDEPALDMLGDILSDGIGSRLYRRLVYDDRIASDAGAFNYSLEAAGITGAVATARPGVPLSRLRDALDEEIARLAADGPTEEEVDRVKVAMQVGFVATLERLSGKADLLARYATFLGDPDLLAEHWDRYRAVTGEDVRRMAELHLSAPRVELLYGDPAADGEPPVVPDARAAAAKWREPAPGALPAYSVRSEPDRSRPPRRGRAGEFRSPEPEIRETDGGLRVVAVPRRDLPKIVGSLVIRAGKVDEPRRLAGLASLVAEMLSRGTENRDAIRFEADADRIGASMGAGSGVESFALSFSCLTEHLRGTLELVSEMLLRPAFARDELERVVPVRLDALKQARAEPTSVARRVTRRGLFGDDHPYGWRGGGDEESLPRIGTDDLVRFHRERLGPEIADVVACGDLDPDDAVALIEEFFGDWTPDGRTLRNAAGPADAAPRSVRLHQTATPGPQTVLSWVRPGPPHDAPDRYALRLALQILGGGFGSRLNLNLRERMGATYGAFAGSGQMLAASQLSASASVNVEMTGAALSELLGEVDRMASGRPPSGRELEEAKRSLVRTHAQRFETLGGVRAALEGLLIREVPLEDLRAFPERVEAVTAEEVAAAARRWLSRRGSFVTAVGDADRIESELEGVGFGPIVRVDADGAPLSPDAG